MNKNDFRPVVHELGREEGIIRPSLGYWKETALLLCHSRTVCVVSTVLLLVILGAVFIPMLVPIDYAAQNVAFSNKPFFSVDLSTGIYHVFGTDYLGRDIFIRLWYGARVSLIVAVVVAVIDCVVGIGYGGVSGYLGGRTDHVMMRLLEIVGGIPYLVIVLLLIAVLPQGIGTLILAYSMVGWTGMARLVRGQVISIKQQEYIVAARIMGAGVWRIIRSHMLPNLLGIILVNMTLDIPGIIFTEAYLSMLGMGVPPPYPSLGVMANDGISMFQVYPMQLVVPAVLICAIMLSFNLLGDRLQDVFNPRLRRMNFHGRDSKDKRAQSDL